MLEARLGQLLGEIHGQRQAPTERKPWQKDTWWEKFRILFDGLSKLYAMSSNTDRLGPICYQQIGETFDIVSTIDRLASVRPSDVTALLSLRLIPDKLAPMPWARVDRDPKSGAELLGIARWLVKDMPPLEAEDKEHQIALAFERLETALADNPELPTRRSAPAAVDKGLYLPASAMLQ